MTTQSHILSTASSNDQWLSLGAALFLIGAALVGLRFATVDGPVLPPFLPAWGMAVLITDLMTAYLLFGQYRVLRQPALAALAGAYIFSSTIIGPLVVAFPGVWDQGPAGVGPQTTIWLWTLWHIGFPGLILLHVVLNHLCPRELTGRPGMAAGLGLLLLPLGLGIGCVALTYGRDLTPLVVKGDYSLMLAHWSGRLMIAVNVLALVGSAIGLRRHSPIQLGLCLAILASALEVIVTLAGGSRFSLGWYLAKADSLCVAAIVLAVFQRELVRLSRHLRQLNLKLTAMAAIDGLTGITNRRRFDEQLEVEWRRAKRDGTALSLILIDVDFFKKYNDLYGHVLGDETLRQVAATLAATARRPGDMAARYGGEEFVLLLPGTDQAGAMQLGARVNEAIRALAIPHGQGTASGIVTVSVGVAGWDGGMPAPADAEQLLRLADAALYEAKGSGRDCTIGPTEPGAGQQPALAMI